MALIRDVLTRGAFILQKDLEEFEDNLRRFLNVKFALAWPTARMR